MYDFVEVSQISRYIAIFQGGKYATQRRYIKYQRNGLVTGVYQSGREFAVINTGNFRRQETLRLYDIIGTQSKTAGDNR